MADVMKDAHKEKVYMKECPRAVATEGWKWKKFYRKL